MPNTVILSFKASTSPLFKKALEAAKEVDTFHTSSDFFVVEFDLEDITKHGTKSFSVFERIYMLTKSWKDCRLKLLSDNSKDSYQLYDMILKRYDIWNRELPKWQIDEQVEKEKSLGWINPFAEGSDEWANWEIDQYLKRSKS